MRTLTPGSLQDGGGVSPTGAAVTPEVPRPLLPHHPRAAGTAATVQPVSGCLPAPGWETPAMVPGDGERGECSAMCPPPCPPSSWHRHSRTVTAVVWVRGPRAEGWALLGGGGTHRHPHPRRGLPPPRCRSPAAPRRVQAAWLGRRRPRPPLLPRPPPPHPRPSLTTACPVRQTPPPLPPRHGRGTRAGRTRQPKGYGAGETGRGCSPPGKVQRQQLGRHRFPGPPPPPPPDPCPLPGTRHPAHGAPARGLAPRWDPGAAGLGGGGRCCATHPGLECGRLAGPRGGRQPGTAEAAAN